MVSAVIMMDQSFSRTTSQPLCTAKVLFLDQSGQPGGAELCLLDIAKVWPDRCLVGLLSDGTFRNLLEQAHIPVQVLTDQVISVQKASGLLQALSSLQTLIAPILRVARLSREFDLIYANTQKALVVGAIASVLSRRPLIYHLHDIISSDHFSAFNQRIIITLANAVAKLVIANSHATKTAFEQAGGQAPVHVVYNGFDVSQFSPELRQTREPLRQSLGLESCFVVGHFSRLAPWKGQYVLIEALQYCPSNVVALLVGDALFGEQEYVQQLHQQVAQLGLGDRVKFLGFRTDISQLMAACDLVAHTSTAPEPFGRVIVEAMLTGTPVVAAEAGGVIEWVKNGQTGWLVPPGDPLPVAEVIKFCSHMPEAANTIAEEAQRHASQHFDLQVTNRQIAQLLSQVRELSQENS